MKQTLFLFIVTLACASALVRNFGAGNQFISFPSGPNGSGVYSLSFTVQPVNVSAVCIVPNANLYVAVREPNSPSSGSIWRCRAGISIGIYFLADSATTVNLTQFAARKISAGDQFVTGEDWEFLSYTPDRFVFFGLATTHDGDQYVWTSPKPTYQSASVDDVTYSLLVQPFTTVNVTTKSTPLLFGGDSVTLYKTGGVVQTVCAPLELTGQYRHSYGDGNGWQGFATSRGRQLYCALASLYFTPNLTVFFDLYPNLTIPTISKAVTTIQCNFTDFPSYYYVPASSPIQPTTAVLLTKVTEGGVISYQMGTSTGGRLTHNCYDTDYYNVTLVDFNLADIVYAGNNTIINIPFGASYFTPKSSTIQQGSLVVGRPTSYLNWQLLSQDSTYAYGGQIFSPAYDGYIQTLNFGDPTTISIIKKNSPNLMAGSSIDTDPKFPNGPLIVIPANSPCVSLTKSDGPFTNDSLDISVGSVVYSPRIPSAFSKVINGELFICKTFNNQTYTALLNTYPSTKISSASRSGTRSGSYQVEYTLSANSSEVFVFPAVSADLPFVVTATTKGNIQLNSPIWMTMTGESTTWKGTDTSLFSAMVTGRWFYNLKIGEKPATVVFVENYGNEAASFILDYFRPQPSCDVDAPCFKSTCTNGKCQSCETGYSGFNCQVSPPVQPTATTSWTRPSGTANTAPTLLNPTLLNSTSLPFSTVATSVPTPKPESRAVLTIYDDNVTEEEAKTMLSQSMNTTEDRIKINSISSSKRQTTTTIDFSVLDRAGDSISSAQLVQALSDKITNSPNDLPFKPKGMDVVSLNTTPTNVTPATQNVVSGANQLSLCVALLFAIILSH